MKNEREREDDARRDVDVGSEETESPLLPAADPAFTDAEDYPSDEGTTEQDDKR